MKTQDMREASAQPGNPKILGGVGTTPSSSYSDLPRWSVLNKGSRAVARRLTRGGQKLQIYIYIFSGALSETSELYFWGKSLGIGETPRIFNFPGEKSPNSPVASDLPSGLLKMATSA
jgi:hypothetical protein